MKLFSGSIADKHICTVGKRNEVDMIMRLTLFIQRIFGQHILDPNWTWKRFFLHQLATSLLVIYVIVGTIEILSNTSDVKIIAEAGYTFVITSIFPCKYLLLVNNRFVFRKLYLEVKTTLYETIRSDSEEKFNNVLSKGIKVVYGLFYMIMLPIMTYIVRAIWYYIYGERVTISRTTSILMPMRTPYHEIGLILHSIYMFEASYTLIMVDMWFVFLMFFFCVASDCTLKILEIDKIENESKEDYAKRLNEALRAFYKIHVKHVDYLNTMNVMFKWLALLPLFNVTMSGCIIFLLMSKGIPWSFAPNMIPCFGELFAYNWFGEQIKIKAQKLNTALLNFDWINLELKDKKSYYIIVRYMQKDFGLKTAIGNDLSLITMTAVLKTSYQAFTVLQTLDV